MPALVISCLNQTKRAVTGHFSKARNHSNFTSPLHDPLFARNFYKEEVNPASAIRSLQLSAQPLQWNFYLIVRCVLLSMQSLLPSEDGILNKARSYCNRCSPFQFGTS